MSRRSGAALSAGIGGRASDVATRHTLLRLAATSLRAGALVVLAILAAACPRSLHAQNFFTGPAGGDYATAGNWSQNRIPGDGNNDQPRIGQGATASAVYSGPSSYTTSARFLIGFQGGGNGSLLMDAGAGTLTFGGDNFSNANYVGVDGGTGTLTMNAGTITLTGAAGLNIGCNNATATGTVTVNSGATINVGSRMLVGANNAANFATLNLNGGTVNVGTGGANGLGGAQYGVLRVGTGTTAVNLNGGLLSLFSFQSDSTSAAKTLVNFNGTTVQARGNNAIFFTNGANNATGTYTTRVQAGGAIFDTNGFNIGVGTALVQDAGSPGGGLTKLGAGTLTLSGANTYTGPTLVQGGTLAVAAGGSLTGAGLINATGGGILIIDGTVTQANGQIFSVGTGIAGTTGTVVVNPGGVLNIGNGGAATLIGGSSTNNNQYGRGILTIAGGTVNVGAPGSGGNPNDASRMWLNPYGNGGATTLNLDGGVLSTARPIGDGGNGQSVFNFNGGTLRAAAGINLLQNNAANTINVRNGGAIIDTQGFTVTIPEVLRHSTVPGDNAIDGGLTKLGGGTLTLSGASTYTGTTTVSNGVLQFSGSGSAYSGGNYAGNIYVESGGTLRFARHDTFGSAAANPAVTITVNGGTVTNSATWFTPLGAVVLNEGTIAANQGHSAWDAFLLKGAVTTVAAANSSYLTSTGSNSAFHLNSTGTTFHVADGAAQHDLIVSGTLANYYPGTAGSLIKTGPGTMTLAGANTYTGGTVVNEGTLRLEGQMPAAWYDAANSASLRQDAGGTTPVTAGGQPVGLWQDVSGNAVHAAQTSAGNRPTYSENGLNGLPALEFSGSQWINSGFNPNYTVVPDMTMLMVYQKVSDTGSNGLWGHDNGGWDRLQLLSFPANPGAANGISTGNGTAATPGVITTDPLVYAAIMRNGVGSGSQVFINGNLDATFTQNHTNTGQASLTFGAINTGGGFPSHVRIGEIMLFPTALSPAERSAWEQYLLYKWGFSTALPQSNFLADNGPVTIAGGTLDLAMFEETVGAVTLQSGSIIGAGALRGSSFDLQSGLVSAALVGPGNAVKTTSGTVLLSGQNTYTGPTAVNGGALLVTGSLGDTAVTVNSGGTLGGTGAIGGNVSVLDGGILSPGMSVGTLNVLGDLAFGAGGFFDIDIAGPGDADLLMMDGGLLSPGDAPLRVSLDFSPQLGDSWTILDGAGSRDGLFNPEVTMLSGSSLIPGWQSFSVGYGVSNGSHWVNLTLVPEPGTWLLLLSALAGGLLVRRRR